MSTPIDIDLNINTAQSAKSLGELKSSLRNLISLQEQVGSGTAGFKKLQEAINSTEGRIGDLNDSFHTLRGSGIERVNSSLGLFKEGLLNADPEKLSIAMKGLGAAMKAIPIFLLIEGLTFLYQNFEKLADAFSSSAQQIKANADALENLTEQVNANKVQTDALIITKEAELKQLERQNAGLKDVVGKIKEIDALKQGQFRNELKATDKEMQNMIYQIGVLREELNLSDLLPNFLGGDATENKIKELNKKLAEASVKRGEIVNKAAAAEVSTDQAVNAEIDKARAKELEKRKARIEAFQAFIKEKSEQEIAIENDRIATENRLHQEELDKVVKQLEEEKDFRKAFAEGNALQDEEISANAEIKRRVKRANAFAFEKAQIKLSTDDRIAQVKIARDTELLNDQLSVEQRVKLIQDSEARILAIKLAAAQQSITISKEAASVIGELNNLAVQNENYRLTQLQYSKDSQLENDKNRTQEALDQETLATNIALNNAQLTSEQRTQIQYDSETRKRNIEIQSANSLLKVQQEFDKKQLEIKKKQFEREKALKLLNIAIDTASALVKTTAELGGVGAITPPGIALLAGVAALGVAQAAVVASQKFDGGGGSVQPAANIDVRGGSGGGSSTPTSFSPPNQNAGNPNGVGNAQNSNANQPTKVYVLEADIRNVAEKVKAIEARATFGK